MQTVNLGRTGLKVTRICFGCMSYGTAPWAEWVLGEAAAQPFFRKAWEAGINFYDTADVYSHGTSEEVLGRALRELKIPREQVVIATKVNGAMGPSPNERGLSKKHILHAIDASLRRLQLDYVDLYQIHRFDPSVPIEETLEALDTVVRAGKALHIGASSMYAWQFAKMLHTSDRLGLARFVTMQNHYNLIYREEEREMNPLCRDEGIGLLPWSPLARGLLARKRGGEATVRSTTDRFGRTLYAEGDLDIVDTLSRVAEARGVSNAEVALAWLLHQPGVVAPIIGATKIEHLDAALKAAVMKLDAEEMKALNASYRLHPVLGHS
jgi:aryl-alcohol dehydrogenase-like predicted oxidoreductase